jgi:hAT family C-terminal dimerisation region
LITLKDFSKAIRKEIAVFEEEEIRGKYLQNCYDYLKNIKPTSVESERAFSASGNFVSKLRSSLEDNTLNAFCFLWAHFKREQKAQKENNV